MVVFMSKKKQSKIMSSIEISEKELFLGTMKKGDEVIIKFFKNCFSQNPTKENLEFRSNFTSFKKEWFFETVEDVLNHKTKLSHEEVKVVGDLFTISSDEVVPTFEY